jgi:diacylglycerol kinase (ATP)
MIAPAEGSKKFIFEFPFPWTLGTIKYLNLDPSVSLPGPIAILCNPNAGKGRALTILDRIIQTLGRRSIPSVCFTDPWPADLRGFDAAWIVGGDGTLNYFINRYPEIGIPIAIFKGGSGNDFAWKLYGEISIPDFLERAIAGKARKVDGGICNGRYFVNGVGIGFDGEVVRAMGNKRFLSAGHMAYLVTVLYKLLSYREKQVWIRIEGNQRSENIFLLSLANGSRYGGGFQVAPQAILDDGLLDLVIIKKIPVWSRFFYVPKVERGSHLGLSFVEFSKEKRILVGSSNRLHAHLDGEGMESDQFDIRVLPGCFSFIY